MFSFFKSSKKHSPRSSPEPDEQHSIPGPDSDFVLVNDNTHKNSNNAGVDGVAGTGQGNLLYPFGNININIPKKTQQDCPVHYLHGVPFNLSTELTVGDSTEITRIQVDEILAFITRIIQNSNEYEFKQERSIVSQ